MDGDLTWPEPCTTGKQERTPELIAPLPSSQQLMCNTAPSGTSASGHFTLTSFPGLVITQNFYLQR